MDKNKELQRQQEDAAFAHGLCWVGGALFVELLIVMLNQFYFNFTTDATSVARAQVAYTIMRVCFFGAPVIFVAALVAGFLQFKKTGTICRVVEGVLGLSGAISLVCSMCRIYKGEGCTMMMLFIPAVGILAFLFFLYQHDFFYSAAICGVAAMVLWMIWHINGNNMVIAIIGAVKVVVFAALMCWMASKLKKSGGSLTLLGHQVRFLSHDALYPVIYISAALAVVTVAIGMVMGGYVAYYLIYALAAWIFALVVYYTVRML